MSIRFLSPFFGLSGGGISTFCKCFLVIAAAYAAVFCVGPYGFNDDYQYLYRAYMGTFDPAHNEQVGMGRPAAAWLLNLGYGTCGRSVDNLVYLRLVSLGGILLFACILNRTLVRAGYSRGFALTVALLVALSPAFGVYAAWAAGFLSPYALALCLLAGLLLDDARQSGSRHWMRWVAAPLLVLLACSLWQAAAPLSLFVSFASAWKRPAAGEATLRATLNIRGLLPAWIVLGLSALGYLLVHRLAVHLGWISLVGTERMALATDPLGKIRLLGDLLRSGLASWARLHSAGWEFLVGGLTLTGGLLSMIVRREDGSIDRPASVFRAGLVAVMILASISPLLVAGENNASFRALPVLYVTMAFLALEGYCHRLRTLAPQTRVLAGHALIAAVAVCAYGHVRYGIVEPNFREYTGVRQQIRRQFQQMPARVVYLLPPATLLSRPWMKASWEYGLVSSSFWWATKPFLLLIFNDLKMSSRTLSGSIAISYREAGNKDLPVINPLPAMLREAGEWRDDPRWGRVQAFTGGWLYSPWFGYLNVKEFPVIQHHILGPLLFIGHGADNLWFHREGLGEFHTSQVAFPYLYVGNTKEWVLLSDDDGAHCSLRDSAGVSQQLPDPMEQHVGEHRVRSAVAAGASDSRAATKAADDAVAVVASASPRPVAATGTRSPFFAHEAALDKGVFYLQFGDRVFGYYACPDFPYLYHFDLGLCYFVDAHDPGGGGYFYDFQGLGWLYTNPQMYPYFYNPDAKAIYFYFAGTKNPRVFVNMNTQEFIRK